MAVTLLRQKQIGDRVAVVISDTGGHRGHSASFQTYRDIGDELGALYLEDSRKYQNDHQAISEFNRYVATAGGAA